MQAGKIMKILKATAIAAAAFGLAMTSHVALADTISHFTAKGALANKAKISGGLYIDTTLGTVTSSGLLIGAPANNTMGNVVSQGENASGNGLYDLGLFSSSGPGANLVLAFSGLNIVDYAGGSLTGQFSNGGSPVAVTTLKLSPDSIKKFYATGSLADGAPIAGYLTIDRTLGVITRSALSLGGPDYTTQVIIQTQQPDYQGSGLYGATLRNVPVNEDLEFVFPTTSLVNYNGGGNFEGFLYDLNTSTFGPAISSMTLGLTPPPLKIGGGFGASSVPEPMSWAMMLTGVCGLGAAMRSRRRTAPAV